MEPRPGAWSVCIALSAASGGRAAGMGHGVTNGDPSRRRSAGGWRRETAARRPAAHHLTLWCDTREGTTVFRWECDGLHRASIPPRHGDIWLLPTAEDAGRSAVDRCDGADAAGQCGLG